MKKIDLGFFTRRFSFLASLAFLALLAPVSTVAEVWGGVEGNWMAWGAGARAVGMGRAYTALAADASAGYWNPAGLAGLERSHFLALRGQMWEGATFDYAAVAFPTLKYGTFGLSGALLNVGGGERRDRDNNLVGEGFGVTKSAWTISYGTRVAPGVEIGTAFTYLGRWLDGLSSGFVTGDAALRVTVVPGVLVGVNVKQAGSWRFGDTEDQMPLAWHAGVAASLFEGLVAAALEWEGSGAWSAGVEMTPMHPLVLRMGTGWWESAAGVGVQFGEIGVDYSGALHRELGFAHRVTFSMQWGESVTLARGERAREAYEAAYEAYRDQRREDALEKANEVLTYQPEHAGALFVKMKLTK